ncbi:MAG: STAS domain-containing protein [Lentisphaeria bacterium]|nr:STAS domain-containing protein [Lentisphaeria bacterium]
MNISKERHGAELTVTLTGRLDTTSAPALEHDLKAVDATVTSLILDFAGVDYVSSAGLRVVLAAQKQMNGRQGTMVLRAVRDAVMEIFEMTGFTDILTFV